MLNQPHRIFLITLLLIGLAETSHPQEPGNQSSRKVDSYNDQIRSSEAEQWHLEDFRELLLKEPNAKAYIIAYGGREDPPGKARRFAFRAKNWLVNWRGITAQRIVPLDGGRREDFVVELWLVPSGAIPPKPTPTVELTDDLGDNVLFDHFDIDYDNFGVRTEDLPIRLEGFAEALKKEPGSRGCVIAYAQSGDDRDGTFWDSPGTALKTAKEHKNYLVKHGIGASRLSAVDGGYSERVVELWIVRPKARFDRGPFIYQGRLKANNKGVLTVESNTSSFCCKACVPGKREKY
jgi:hypothetical protein